MATTPKTVPKARGRRGRGDDGISWDKANNSYVGTVSLGHDSAGKRRRRTVRAKTKTEDRDKPTQRPDDINAETQTPATYTVKQGAPDWLAALTLNPDTV